MKYLIRNLNLYLLKDIILRCLKIYLNFEFVLSHVRYFIKYSISFRPLILDIALKY